MRLATLPLNEVRASLPAAEVGGNKDFIESSGFPCVSPLQAASGSGRGVRNRLGVEHGQQRVRWKFAFRRRYRVN
jgi:hypothetical protein